MSEEPKLPTAAEAEPAVAEKPAAPRASTAQLWAIAALLIALGTLIGGYFVWHEVQRLGAWQQQVLNQIDGRGAALEQRLQSFKDRLESDLAAGERSRRALEEEQRRLTDAQQGLEEALGVLRAQLGSSQQDWTLAEVEYLLQVANQRLQLMRDPATARAALVSADRRLQALGDPGFNAVREQIAQDLAALQAVETPDRTGIAMTLESLARQVDQFPLQDAQSPRTIAPQDDSISSPPVGDWKRLPRLIWDELRSLVTVRRNETPVGPMLAPEQQFFLYENLRLQLTSARVAALQEETASYRASLRTAANWLREHFSADAPQVTAARDELERLATVELRPALPDISNSLRLLRQQRQLIGNGGPGSEATEEKSPPASGPGDATGNGDTGGVDTDGADAAGAAP